METEKPLIIASKKKSKYEKAEKFNKPEKQQCEQDNEVNLTMEILSDDFEKNIEDSMNDLESLDHFERHDSEADIIEDKLIAWPGNSTKRTSVDTANHVEFCERRISASSESSNNSDNEEESSYRAVEEMDPFRSPESKNQNILWRPLSIPFQERRRLSQCKEEDEDESERAQNGSGGNSTVNGRRHKFIVTKTEMLSASRPEAEKLRDVSAKQNAATIHFPCSSVDQRASLNSVFQKNDINPHLDKRYFDTSLVEIRSVNGSTKSLNKSNNQITDDTVWVPRPDVPVVSISIIFTYPRIITFA